MTQSAIHELAIRDFDWPHARRYHTVDFNLLTGANRTAGNGWSTSSPHHSISTITLTGSVRHESISLASDKAERLVRIFRELSGNEHMFDCHSFLFALEGWDDSGETTLNHRAISDDEAVEPGVPYQVLVNGGTAYEPDWFFTHSAIGTNEGRLLGLTGQGMPIGTMDRETTLQIHGRGLSAYLAATSVAEDGQYVALAP